MSTISVHGNYFKDFLLKNKIIYLFFFCLWGIKLEIWKNEVAIIRNEIFALLAPCKRLADSISTEF